MTLTSKMSSLAGWNLFFRSNGPPKDVDWFPLRMLPLDPRLAKFGVVVRDDCVDDRSIGSIDSNSTLKCNETVLVRTIGDFV